MATNAHSEFDKVDTETGDIPQGGDTVDNSYATGGGDSSAIPVVKDETPIEQPSGNPDSDAALGTSTGVFSMEY